MSASATGIEFIQYQSALEPPTELRRLLADTDRRLIVAMDRIASVVGPDFFPATTQLLAALLDARYVFMSECIDSESQMSRTLAFWSETGLAENLDFCVRGGPCEKVLANETVHVRDGVLEQFPHNDALHLLGPRSYFGCPLVGSKGRVIGHIAAMDAGPMNPSPEDLAIMRILASRAAAELERRQIEKARKSELLQADYALKSEIKHRQSIQRSLRTSEEQFRLVADSSPICVLYIDADGRIQFVNRTYEEWFGGDRREIQGQDIRAVLGEESYGAIGDHAQAALSGTPAEVEVMIRVAETEREVSAQFLPHYDADGAVTGYIALLTVIT